MKLASICIMKANSKQSIAAFTLNAFIEYILLSTKASATPTIIGTAAPAKVLGLAARTHAFIEFFITVFSTSINLNFKLAKLNIK